MLDNKPSAVRSQKSSQRESFRLRETDRMFGNFGTEPMLRSFVELTNASFAASIRTETGYKMRIAKASPDVNAEAAMEVVRRFVGQTASVEADMTYEYVVNLGFPSVDSMVDLFKFFEENKVTAGGQRV